MSAPREGAGDHSRRHARARHSSSPGRLLWWVAAVTPPVVALAMYVLERRGTPGYAPGYDLSEIISDLAALSTVLVGAAMAVAAVMRERRQVRRIAARSDRSVLERLRMMREWRLRTAWFLLVGTCLIIVGIVLLLLQPQFLG